MILPGNNGLWRSFTPARQLENHEGARILWQDGNEMIVGSKRKQRGALHKGEVGGSQKAEWLGSRARGSLYT